MKACSKIVVPRPLSFCRCGAGGVALGKERGVSLSGINDRRVKRPEVKPTCHIRPAGKVIKVWFDLAKFIWIQCIVKVHKVAIQALLGLASSTLSRETLLGAAPRTSSLLVYSFLAFTLTLGSCFSKVPLIKQDLLLKDLRGFWFEGEQTLFVFYTLENRHGFSDLAVIELNMADPSSSADWQDVTKIATVHQHLDAQCGRDQRCQSLSIQLKSLPRQIRLRYRYHRDGTLSESFPFTPLAMDMAGIQPESSLKIFGVFDESNRYTQWRGWHNFPGMSQEEVVKYGLVRPFAVHNAQLGSQSLEVNFGNPTLFDQIDDCFSLETFSNEVLVSSAGEPLWQMTPIPEGNQDSPWVTTEARVDTGSGLHRGCAVARKNPEFTASPAQLQLRFAPTQVVRLLFTACQPAHRDDNFLNFQKQRLLFDQDEPDSCIDDATFEHGQLAKLISQRILAARQSSQADMSLIVILHYTEATAQKAIQRQLEHALITVSLDESLGLRGIFVYDSFGREDLPTEFIALGAWCPSLIGGVDTFNSCLLLPSSASLGPLELQLAPVLPSWPQFQTLESHQIEDVKITSLEFFAPKATIGNPLRFVDSITNQIYFFDPLDILSVAKDHALSYCATEDGSHALAYASDTIAEIPSLGPLALLPAFHQALDSSADYNLGVVLNFPYLLQLSYQTTVRIGPKNYVGYVSIKNSHQEREYLGDPTYLIGAIKIADALKHCIAFCHHPAFDDRGAYHFSLSFAAEYSDSCHRPQYPIWQSREEL